MSGEFRVQSLTAPDGRFLRAAIWDLPESAKPRAVAILLGGHGEFAEKYGEVAGELNARGLVVVTLDWRGQGASDRLARGNHKSHVRRFADFELDLTTLLKQVAEPIARQRGPSAESKLPLVALAHSMGAHILLRFLHDYPGRIACGVLSAPMIAVQLGSMPPWAARLILFFFNLKRPSETLLFGASARDPLTLPFAQNRVTSDEARYARTQTLLKAQPYLRVDGPTFGWLGAAFQSMRLLNRPRYAREIETPLLVVGAGKDRVVVTQATRDFVKLLPNASYVEIAESEHEILMEKDSIRAQFWAAFDTFVNGKLGA